MKKSIPSFASTIFRVKTLGNLRLVALLFLAILSACNTDDEGPSEQPGVYAGGAFILNEGTFGQGNASVTFYSYEGDSVVQNIFTKENNRPLGDVLQSGYVHDDIVYLIVNNSGKVEVTDLSFQEKGVIEGVNSPRFMAFSGRKGYVSQWGNGGKVMEVDLDNLTLTDSVEVGSGPEGFLLNGNDLLVANAGGYGLDSTVSVIDLATLAVTNTIQVGYNPTKMVKDKNNNVWVLCAGSIEYDVDWNVVGHLPSKLYRLSAGNYAVEKEIMLFEEGHPRQLQINADGETLYIGGGITGIYAFQIDDDELAATPLIGGKSFYGFNYNAGTNEIYAGEAPSFTSNGSFSRYSATGTFIKTYPAGIGPNGAFF